MKICSTCHTDIVFLGESCPLCAALVDAAEKLAIAQETIQQRDGRIDELQIKLLGRQSGLTDAECGKFHEAIRKFRDNLGGDYL